MSEQVIAALRAQIVDAQSKSNISSPNRSEKQKEILIDENHPKVKEILKLHTIEFQDKLNGEKEKYLQ